MTMENVWMGLSDVMEMMIVEITVTNGIVVSHIYSSVPLLLYSLFCFK